MSQPTSQTQPSSTGQWLSAGPIRVKYEEGQLRYLYVGNKEIVRRIYFGVRDGDWNTATPVYSKQQVDKAADHFTIHVAAHCKRNQVDYSWTGTITGTVDGKITYEATGAANSDFDSNRIGLCVLFGVHSLAGQEFETDGKTGKSEFPHLVSPTLVGEQFHTLKYTTPAGLHVTCGLEGAIFDMEDQRNWGDSSWKAYAPLPYNYKRVTKGDQRTETVTITVSGETSAQPLAQDPVHLTIGDRAREAKIPALVSEPTAKVPEFTEISFHHDKYKDAKEIAWSYIPTTHLPDDDTIMENLPSVAYQARTVKEFNPNAVLKIGPIGLSQAGDQDPRDARPLAAAWAMGMVKFLALGGVDEAAFALDHGPADPVLEAIKPYAHQPLVLVETKPANSHHVVAFATEKDKEITLFVMNHSLKPAHVEIDDVEAEKVKVVRLAEGAKEQASDVMNDTVKLELAPYEVVKVTMEK